MGLSAVSAVLIIGISLRIGSTNDLLVMFKNETHIVMKIDPYHGGEKQNPDRVELSWE